MNFIFVFDKLSSSIYVIENGRLIDKFVGLKN